MSGFRAIVGAQVFAAMIALIAVFGSAPVSAQTYSTTQIIVSGQAFVIGIEDANFNTANDRHGGDFLTSQPWWGVGLDTAFNSSTGTIGARLFQNTIRDTQEAVFKTILTELGATGDNQAYALAFTDSATNPTTQVNARRIHVTTFAGSFAYTSAADFSKTSDTDGSLNMVYLSAVAVPEIDGPVLAQVSFILMAMLLFLRTRRTRADGAAV